MTIEAALAFVIGAIWLGAIVALAVWVSGRRLRRVRRGGRPLHLIPWYLGGETEMSLDPPPESSRRRRRRLGR